MKEAGQLVSRAKPSAKEPIRASWLVDGREESAFVCKHPTSKSMRAQEVATTNIDSPNEKRRRSASLGRRHIDGSADSALLAEERPMSLGGSLGSCNGLCTCTCSCARSCTSLNSSNNSSNNSSANSRSESGRSWLWSHCDEFGRKSSSGSGSSSSSKSEDENEPEKQKQKQSDASDVELALDGYCRSSFACKCAKRPDCCNRQLNSTNQFSSYQQQTRQHICRPPRLRHRRSPICFCVRIGVCGCGSELESTATNRSAINKAFESVCASRRCRASGCLRALDSNYDTKTLFSNRDAPRKRARREEGLQLALELKLEFELESKLQLERELENVEHTLRRYDFCEGSAIEIDIVRDKNENESESDNKNKNKIENENENKNKNNNASGHCVENNNHKPGKSANRHARWQTQLANTQHETAPIGAAVSGQLTAHGSPLQAPKPEQPAPTGTANERRASGRVSSHSLSQIVPLPNKSHLPMGSQEKSDSQQSKESWFAMCGRQTHPYQQLQQQQQQHKQQDERLLAPFTFPNNTLIVDLNKCHHNIATLWPRTTRASGNKLGACWPTAASQKKGKSRKHSFHIPESLLRTNVKLKADDYDKALSVLTSDARYQLHLLLYRKAQTIWLLLSTILCILVSVVLTNLETIVVVGICFVWLGLQIVGACASAQLRKKLDQMLEKSVAQVNSFLMDHNLMLGVINVGGLLSKAKLVIPMLYFDTSQCREQIESIISIDSRKGANCNSSDNDDNNKTNQRLILDYSKIDLPLTKPNTMALAQSLAKKIVLRYSQRWISYFDRRKLLFTDDRTRPRHLSTGKCLCQFIEEHFSNTETSERAKRWPTITSPHADTKATLVLNEKQQPKETRVKPHVIRNLELQATPTIPTLSRLVSLQGRASEHFKIEMGSGGAGQLVQAAPQTNGSALSSWQLQLGDQALNKTKLGTNQTTVSSPDVSLSISGDSIGRSDDLVRKLRLLLELKKNELQGIDGSLFSSVLYKAPQPLLDPNRKNNTDNIGVNMDLVGAVAASEERARTKGNGKKFYSQGEGLFFLGSNGAKRNQQDASGGQVLEIC